MDRFRPGWVYDTSDQEPVQANTISELAQKLGIDPEKLSNTISDFVSIGKSQFVALECLEVL